MKHTRLAELAVVLALSGCQSALRWNAAASILVIGFTVRAGASEAPCETRTVEAEVDGEAAVRYLLSHEKPNGAFGPAGHGHTDLAWNYPAAHALRLLGQAIPHPAECFQNGRDALYKQAGSHNTVWAWDIYQRAQLAAVMCRPGEDGLGLSAAWTLEPQERKGQYYFKIADAKLKKHIAPFCDIPTLACFVEAVTASGGHITNPEAARAFLLPRQAASGAFVDAETPVDAVEADAHVLATAQAVFVLRALKLDVPRAAECAAWLQRCQDGSGGFRWSPTSAAPSNRPDVWYTWAAVRALALLGAKPSDADACLAWLNALQNPDGGFGDRPGWNSRLYSTYYAVHALQALTGDAKGAIRKKRATALRKIVPENAYTIFQSHLKSPPGGIEMVEAARAAKLNLVGVKENSPNAPAVKAEAARTLALEKGYPLEILASPEQYAHQVKWHGGHPANHVANYLYPATLAPEARARWDAAEAAGKKGLPWSAYGAQVIAPIVGCGTLFYPELDYEMMNAYMVYDDGLDGACGYNAVIGALGWPVWDWIRFFPYRERWVGKLPILADGDAHGDVVKWGERWERQRMLYLAKNHDLASFLDACRDNRTVCVIRGGSNKMELAFYGDPAVVDYVKRRRADWQWWTETETPQHDVKTKP